MKVKIPPHWAKRILRVRQEQETARMIHDRASEELSALLEGVCRDQGVDLTEFRGAKLEETPEGLCVVLQRGEVKDGGPI